MQAVTLMLLKEISNFKDEDCLYRIRNANKKVTQAYYSFVKFCIFNKVLTHFLAGIFLRLTLYVI